MVGAAALFDGATPFPGSLALIPTLGAAAFIIGGISLQNTVSRGPVPLTERFLAARPFQWVGDASYSIYLWHWPIFLILPYVFGHSFDGPATAIPVALTLVLSALSHRFIEEPLRRSNDRIQPLHRAFIFALLGSIIIGGTGGSAYQMIPRLAAHQLQTAQTLIAANPCAGAAALLDSQCATQRPGSTGDSLLLPPLAAAFDLSNVYVRNCRWTPGMTEFPVCEYGVTPDPQSIEIALVGNSHAVQWLPALEILAPDLHLHITTHLANGCFLGSIKLNYSDPNDVALCQQFTSVTMNRILESRPDLVVISGLSDYSGLIFQDVTQSFESVLKNLTDANIDVLAISDSPRPDPPMSIPECVSMNEHDLSKCDGPRETWLHPDPIIVAANNIGEPSIATVDLTDGFCDEKTCHGVVGGIIVYFDDDHVTTSFARTLAPYLQPAIVAALEQTFS